MRSAINWKVNASIIILLVIIVASLEIASPEENMTTTINSISLDKDTFTPGELMRIHLTLDNYTGYDLSIINSKKTYKYAGALKEDIFFEVRDLGENTINLMDKDQTKTAIEKIFTVKEQETQTPKTDNITNTVTPKTQKISDQKISIDKNEYFLDEKVVVALDIPKEIINEYKLYYEYQGKAQRYMGDWANIEFYPQGIGENSLILTRNDIEEYHITFSVIGQNTTTPTSTADQTEDAKNIKERFKLLKNKQEQEYNILSLTKKGNNNDKKYDISLEKIDADQDLEITRMTLNNIILDQNTSIKIESLKNMQAKIPEHRIIKHFSIDPTGINFTTGTISIIAKGTQLWKCKDWNDQTQTCTGKWTLQKNIIPGTEYTIEINSTDPGYAETGVASINTNKSTYHINESVKITSVVLDNQGYLLSGSNVTIIVTNPQNATTTYSTDSGTIFEESRGIYTLTYDKTQVEGVYELFVQAFNWSANYSMFSSFEVSSFYEFDILRNMPVTIDPWRENFNANITLISYNHSGLFSFTEKLPSTFTVQDRGGALISYSGDKLLLTWFNLSNQTTIYYSVSVPQATPELYEIGPAIIDYKQNNFQESRPWFLAVDPVLYTQVCEGQDDNSQDTYNDACDGTYPAACGSGSADRLTCNDGNYETHTCANNNQWAGVRMSSYNSSIQYCAIITSAYLCYEWWQDANNDFDNARIAVDNDNWVSPTTISSTVPGTSLNPGVTCTNVTASDNWNCGNFDGTGTAAQGVAQAQTRSNNGRTLTIDVLFFNITYITDYPPNVTSLNYPSNGTNFTSNSLSFNFTATDDYRIQNCSLYMNISGWTIQGTKFNVTNNTITNITISPSDGIYLWNIRCWDNASTPYNSYYGSNYTIKIDTTGPVTTLDQPANFTNISATTYLVNATVSDALSNISTVLFWYRLNSTASWVSICNDTTAPYSCNWNTSSLNQLNSYQILAYSNDSLSNVGGNSTRVNITIDRTGPVIVLGMPTNFTTITSTTYTVNATVSDALSPVDKVIFEYRINTTGSWNNICNVTPTSGVANCTWNLTGLSYGSTYQVQARANDTLGNIGANDTHTNISFQVLWPPAISNTQCFATSWKNCSSIVYGDTLEMVRTNCSSNNNGSISNVSFMLKNINDDYVYFNGTTTNITGNYWQYDFTDFPVYDSGTFNLNVICRENPENSTDINWSIPFGTLLATLIRPNISINVTRNQFFNFTSMVSCVGGECGYVNASLDPSSVVVIYNQTGSFNWTVPAWVTMVDVLVVAGGGGGGGTYGGGGGAGGLRWVQNHSVTPNEIITITVGAGGNGGDGTTTTDNPLATGSTGENSSFDNITSIGGGYGQGGAMTSGGGGNGGSGGGGGGITTGTARPGGTGTSGQGNNGGSGSSGTAAGQRTGGGGGGAGAAGTAGTNTDAGDGGNGLNFSSEFGTSVGQNGWFAGGGGGGKRDTGGTAGTGGQGGGGAGNIGAASPGSPGINRTGGGGGAGGGPDTSSPGGAGGSGIVILRYIGGKGLIPVGSGTPFYTTSANPMFAANNSCLANLRTGSTCNTTWSINATGSANTTWEFFVTYASLNYSVNVSPIDSSIINISIINNVAPVVQWINLTPLAPTSGMDLNCSFNVTDPSMFDSLTANVRWYKNGVLNYSVNISVNNGIATSHILGSGNLSTGQTWFCGVIPYDRVSNGNQVNSSNVTILASNPPTINNIQCQENGSTWASCSNIAFSDILTAVRVNCTDTDGTISNATFNLTNTEHTYTYFNNITTTQQAGYWMFNNTDIQINYSGTYNLNVTCTDNSAVSTSNTTTWNIPWGTLVANLVSPSSNINVTKNQFFNFTSSVTCTGGECGNIKATLDPISTLIAADGGWTDNDGTTDESVGSYINTTSDDNTYFAIGETGNGDNANSWINLTFNISSLNIPAAAINNLSFSLTYCHSGDNNIATFACDGDAEEKGLSGTQDIWVYNYSSGAWVDIGNLDTTNGGFEVTNIFVPGGNLSNYVSANNLITIRVEIVTNNGAANEDSSLGIDYAFMNLNYSSFEKGTISKVPGATPFYTTSDNPMYANYTSCLANLTSGNSCNTTWSVNSTGIIDTIWTFFVTYASVNYSTYVNPINSSSINLTIKQNVPPVVQYVNISPSSPGLNSNLTCSFMVTDSSPLDVLTANVRWYKNGVLNYSVNISVNNGIATSHILGSGNLSTGQTWFCGVIPYDRVSNGNQVNSSNVTILASNPPTINNIQCQENGSTWASCSNIAFSDILTAVRVNCTDTDGTISNATFNLTNTEHTYTYFNNITTTQQAGYWMFNNTDIQINYSGTYNLNVTCTDNSAVSTSNTTTWNIPWGTLVGTLVNPYSNTNVEHNAFFNFTASVSCIGGECGNIQATLDPISVKTAVSGQMIDNDGNTDESAGSYINTNSDDNTYFAIGETGNGDNANSIIELTFNISSLNVLNAAINSMNFSLTYCHSGDNNIATFACDGDAEEKGLSGTQDIWVYNYSSGAWVDIGNLDTTNGGFEVTNIFTVPGNMSDYVSTSKLILMRVEIVTNVGATNDDSSLGIDYATLNINYIGNKEGAVSTVNGTLPFYTINPNPQNYSHNSCLANLMAGSSSCNVSWLVNATGVIGSIHEFWVDFNMTSNQAYVSNKSTPHINITIIDSGAIPPIVTLNYPNNGNISRNSSIVFNCSATDNLGLTNISLYGNFNGAFTINGTNNVSGTSNTSIFIRTLPDGVYLWNCLAYDTNGNLDWGDSNRTLTVDSTGPIINLSSPENGTNFTVSSITFNYTVIDNIDSTLVCNLSIDSVVRDPNFNAGNGSYISRTINNIAQGYHYWNVTCIDDAGNVNTSVTRTFNITDITPSVTLLTPSPISQQTTWINLSYNATDNNNVTLATLYLNGVPNATNTSVQNGAISWFNISGLAQGVYNWTVNVSDISNLSAQATPRIFIIDYTGPSINISYPQNNFSTNSSSIIINFSVTDNLDYDGILVCNITVNGIVRDPSFNANNGSWTPRTINNLADGLNYWNITCKDDALNVNTSETRIINVSSPPTVSLNNPVENHSQNSPSITLYYTPTDNTNLSSCTLILNDAPNATNTTIYNGIQNNFSLANLSSGRYNWTVSCNDTFNQTTTASPAKNFIIDSLGPNIELYYPLPNETIYATNINFNFTASDNFASTLICNLTLDGSVNITNINANNGSYVNRTVEIYSDDIHYWNITCADGAGNINNSETRNFTTNMPPTVNLIEPANQTLFNYSQNINFSYTATDTGSVVNSSLIINGVVNNTNNIIDTEGINYYFVNLTDGRYNWTIIAYDNNGLIGETETRIFTVDTTPPNVTYIIPTNGQTISSNNVTFIFNVTDNLDDVLECTINLSGDITPINVSNGMTGSISDIFGDGTYNWSVTCNDHANLTNNYSLINFTVEAPPNVTLNFPLSTYRTAGRNITFNYTPYDMIGFANCSLYINDIYNQTNSSQVIRDSPNYFNVTNIPDGNYNWTTLCIDDAPDLNPYSPVVELFVIDNQGPIILLNLPAEGSAINENNVTFNWTASDYANSTISCNLTIDGILNQTNISNVSGSYFVTTVTNMSDGPHRWNVTCIDDLGNPTTSSTANFTINQPDLIINNSRLAFNNTNPNINEQISITANITNIGGVPATNVVVAFWDGMPNTGIYLGNQTRDFGVNITVIFNLTWNITSGYHTIWVVADPYNQIGELNETNNNASINISVLFSNITSPQNGTITSDSTPQITFNLTEFTSNNITYRVFIDGSLNGQNGSVVSGSATSLNLSNLSNGIHNIKVQATDILGRSKNSTALTITIDTQAPTPTFVTTNSTYFNNGTPTVQIRITDNIDTILNYTIYVNSTANVTGSISNNTIANISLSGLANGSYTLMIEAFDDAGNYGNSSNITIIIDTVQPYIVLNSPQEMANITENYARLNFTAYDNLDPQLLCNLTLDGSIVSQFNASNGIDQTYNATNLSETTHYWNVTCTDHALNTNTSQTRQFNIYSPPFVVLHSPPNNTLSKNSSITLYFNASDETGLQNCSLILNGAINQTNNNTQLINNATNNFTITNLNGTYTWAVTCYDNTTAHLQNTSQTWNFTIDRDAPIIRIITNNQTWFNTTTPTITFNISDNFDTLINYTIYVNGIQNKNGSSANASLNQTALTPITPNGNYTIIIEAADDAGNIANSTSIIIYIDTTAPWINLSAPTNGIQINATSVELNFTPYDLMSPYLICNLSISNGMTELNLNITSSTQANITKSGFTSGIYYWNVTCYDVAGNMNTSATWNFTIAAPDLVITSANISFNDTTFEEGKNITIYANIFNKGGIPANNFTVKFWLGDPDLPGSTQINGNVTGLTLSVNQNITINVTHSPLIGPNNIFVEVDPPTATNGTIIEENESNNKANKTFTVSLYQSYAGNLSVLIDMEKQSRNRSLYDWGVTKLNGSHVFVTDTDGSINFFRMQALGRNTTNQTTLDDFANADTKLGTTNLTDSINRTYTQNNNPIQTLNMTIYGNNIYYIPVVNSSANISSFKTGILWDTSDGGTEYGGTQDLIFVSNIAQGAQGSRGNYDFEIAVPALLRNYNTTGSSVAFYIEIV